MISGKGARADLRRLFLPCRRAWRRRAGAAEVYPGCAQPGPTSANLVRRSGQRQDAGDGRSWHAGRTRGIRFRPSFLGRARLQRSAAVDAPYRTSIRQARLRCGPAGGRPVQPGDTILLMSGNYGDIVDRLLVMQASTTPLSSRSRPRRARRRCSRPSYIRSTYMVCSGHQGRRACRHEYHKQPLGHSSPTSGAALPTVRHHPAEHADLVS